VPVVAHDAQCRDIEQQSGRDKDVGADECRANRTQDVAVGEGQDPAARLAGLDQELLGTSVDLRGILTAGAPVVVDLPAGIHLVDLD
jgi:hypothetical protein